MADERLDVAGVPGDLRLCQNGAEKDGVRPAILIAQAVWTDKAIVRRVIERKVNLLECLPVERCIADQIATL